MRAEIQPESKERILYLRIKEVDETARSVTPLSAAIRQLLPPGGSNHSRRSNMHRRRMAIIAIFSAAALASFTLQSVVPASASTNLSMCDNVSGSSTPCLNDQGGDSAGGTPIIMYKQDSDASQNMAFYPIGQINVNHYDPFEGPASSLNSTYSGDEVVQLSFESVGSGSGCAALKTSGDLSVVLEDCGAAVPTDWVLAPPKTGTYCSVVNIGSTNTKSTYTKVMTMVMTGNNDGGQAVVSQWDNSAAQRWEWAGTNLPYCPAS
jgi:hypothetical protein